MHWIFTFHENLNFLIRLLMFHSFWAKVDAAYYGGKLLPMLVDDCKRLLPSGFIFQQDGAPAHMAWCRTSRGPTVPVPTSSQRMNGHQIHQTSTHLTIMCVVQWFRYFTKFTQTTQDHSGAKKCTAADLGWLSQTPINKAINDFRKRLNACVSVGGGHFEHTIWTLYAQAHAQLCLWFQKL